MKELLDRFYYFTSSIAFHGDYHFRTLRESRGIVFQYVCMPTEDLKG